MKLCNSDARPSPPTPLGPCVSINKIKYLAATFLSRFSFSFVRSRIKPICAPVSFIFAAPAFSQARVITCAGRHALLHNAMYCVRRLEGMSILTTSHTARHCSSVASVCFSLNLPPFLALCLFNDDHKPTLFCCVSGVLTKSRRARFNSANKNLSWASSALGVSPILHELFLTLSYVAHAPTCMKAISIIWWGSSFRRIQCCQVGCHLP